MREQPRDPARLEHIVESITNVQGFMDGKSVEDLKNDLLLLFGVVKGLEIIGEASYKLTNEFKALHPSTPWGLMIGLRHVLVHGYYQVKPEEVYLIVKNDLPILLNQVRAYLGEFDI